MFWEIINFKVISLKIEFKYTYVDRQYTIIIIDCVYKLYRFGNVRISLHQFYITFKPYGIDNRWSVTLRWFVSKLFYWPTKKKTKFITQENTLKITGTLLFFFLYRLNEYFHISPTTQILLHCLLVVFIYYVSNNINVSIPLY